MCKCTLCEKLDECCVNALVEIEKEAKISRHDSEETTMLKIFSLSEQMHHNCAMKALLKLVAKEESGKPAALSKEFN